MMAFTRKTDLLFHKGSGRSLFSFALMRALFCSALFCCLLPADAANTNRSKQKSQAEAQRAELQEKLKALKNDIYKTETAKDKPMMR